jgi:hypothetical protein
MENNRFRELLALAERHLAEAHRVIREQEERLNELVSTGADTSEAQALLEKLRASAESMAEHEKSIEQQILAFDEKQDR